MTILVWIFNYIKIVSNFFLSDCHIFTSKLFVFINIMFSSFLKFVYFFSIFPSHHIIDDMYVENFFIVICFKYICFFIFFLKESLIFRIALKILLVYYFYKIFSFIRCITFDVF